MSVKPSFTDNQKEFEKLAIVNVSFLLEKSLNTCFLFLDESRGEIRTIGTIQQHSDKSHLPDSVRLFGSFALLHERATIFGE